MMHLDIYADYLRQVEPRTESRAVRAFLTTGGPRTKKLHGRYVEVYGPYHVMLNVDGIIIHTRTYVTTDSDQMEQIYLGQEELKIRRIGQDAMMEPDAVHIGYKTDVTAHLLDTNGKKFGVTGLLDTGAVVSVMPIKTWERMGSTREDLNPKNLSLAAMLSQLSTNAPTPEELRLKSKEYLSLKPTSRPGYYKKNYGNVNIGPANQGNNWYKPRDDIDERRSCANCSWTDHRVSA